ncbi:MAG TPA: hypothetical protein VGQ76_25735 [Thermoanaerobaculia bacterium]|jgi:hypothetical protein|nr:hypothetical protein [Thermoanaerobaculia bacterium]
MPYKLPFVAVALLLVCVPLSAQEQKDVWSWAHKTEIRANYRWSEKARVTREFPSGPDPQTPISMDTPDPGSHLELNVADIQLDLGYGEWIAARAKVHFAAKHRKNPTTTDDDIDADELWVRLGVKPEFLARPEGTSFFIQAGKFPKMERQPVRLLESYGLAATSFNRFEDVQVQIGGTIGRSFYWRAQAANGNPLFMRDPNALSGDNGTAVQIIEHKQPALGSGFPILYNAETEDLFFDTSNVQIGEALGYRWQSGDESRGFDVIVFHYQRDLADTVPLTGTLYGGDLDLLVVKGSEVQDTIDRGLPITDSRRKEELGARIYGEWGNATAIAQMTWQEVAGLKREGWELELGYRWALKLGPIESIQPAVRVSNLDNHFIGHPQFPATSVRWDWRKYDGGVRVGLTHGFDVTFEYAKHDAFGAAGRVPIDMSEALVTVRWRI